jgi:ubiquinone/menaquinone biosynthesis C-methylase UbiE
MKISVNQEQIQETKSKDSFDVRIVRYEYIHSIKDEFFEELVKIANPKSNEYILDAGCGYGSVTREILKRKKDKKLICFLADSNHTQLLRAKEELTNFNNTHKSELKFYIDNLIDTKFKENTFDTIIAKMVIHEIPFKKQQQAIENAYRILKPGGKLIIWDMALDAKTQKFIQEIIRMKDKLAGFKTLERNRYFLRFDEIKTLLSNSGFSKVKNEYKITSPVITHKRLEQEFGNDILKLNKWHKFIREKAKELEPKILKQLQMEDSGDSISFVPQKAIITAVK